MGLARAAMAEARRAVPALRWEVMDGQVPPALVPTLMNGADCLLVTSDWEGSPVVIQEALACGLPVVSVDVGRRRSERDVWACPTPASRRAVPRLWVAALAGMVEPPRRTDGLWKIAEFSAATIATKLCQIYTKLARENR